MIDWLRRYWVYIVLVILLFGEIGHAELLRRALINERVNPDLMQAFIDATKSKQPVEVKVNVPGSNLPPINVVVTPQGPRVNVEVPSILCRTEEECRRIFGQAEQTINVNTELKLGTVVAVCLVDLVNAVCPSGQVANRPLARGFSLHIALVRLTGGAFTAALEPGSPLGITSVTTSTKPIEITTAAIPLPYNLAFPAVRAIFPSDLSRSLFFAGAVYQNYYSSGGGIYEIGAGFSNAGWAVSLGYAVPVR
jgi:hypothetical protein